MASSTVVDEYVGTGGPRLNNRFVVDAYSGLVNDLKGNVFVNLDATVRVSLTDVGNNNLAVGHDPGGAFSIVADLNAGGALLGGSAGNKITAPNGRDRIIIAATNMDRLAVGVVFTGTGAHAFVYDLSSSVMTMLDRFEGRVGVEGWLNDMNDSGIAVGAVEGNPGWIDCNQEKAGFTQIELPPGCSGGEATAINNSGTIVGYFHNADGHQTAFVSYRQSNGPGPAQDLNQLLAATGTVRPIDYETYFSCANDINEPGEIVGVANGSYQEQAFLLQPIQVILKAENDPALLAGEIAFIIGQWPHMGGGGAPPPPRGPGRGAVVRGPEREVLAGLATASLAELFGSEEARKKIQQAALEAAAAGIASLQKRAAAPRAAIPGKLPAEQRRRASSRFQRLSKTLPGNLVTPGQKHDANKKRLKGRKRITRMNSPKAWPIPTGDGRR
jgi:hypothetical protein